MVCPLSLSIVLASVISSCKFSWTSSCQTFCAFRRLGLLVVSGHLLYLAILGLNRGGLLGLGVVLLSLSVLASMSYSTEVINLLRPLFSLVLLVPGLVSVMYTSHPLVIWGGGPSLRRVLGTRWVLCFNLSLLISQWFSVVTLMHVLVAWCLLFLSRCTLLGNLRILLSVLGDPG